MICSVCLFEQVSYACSFCCCPICYRGKEDESLLNRHFVNHIQMIKNITFHEVQDESTSSVRFMSIPNLVSPGSWISTSETSDTPGRNQSRIPCTMFTVVLMICCLPRVNSLPFTGLFFFKQEFLIKLRVDRNILIYSDKEE